MMKNGVTDVVTFIETTITKVDDNVFGAIVEEHNRDQQLVNDLLDRFDFAIAAMEARAASVEQQHVDRTEASIAHKMCRSRGHCFCGRSRKCEEKLEDLWDLVKLEETEMRRIHDAIHGEWSVGPSQLSSNFTGSLWSTLATTSHGNQSLRRHGPQLQCQAHRVRST